MRKEKREKEKKERKERKRKEEKKKKRKTGQSCRIIIARRESVRHATRRKP